MGTTAGAGQGLGFKKLLSVFWRTHRYFCCLHHWVSTASFASFHLHLTSTHRLCCQLRLVEFFELNGRVHTSTRDRPLGSALGVATFINQFRLLKVVYYPRVAFGFVNRIRDLNVPFFLLRQRTVKSTVTANWVKGSRKISFYP